MPGAKISKMSGLSRNPSRAKKRFNVSSEPLKTLKGCFVVVLVVVVVVVVVVVAVAQAQTCNP